jgi:hypothetical protein
MNPSGVRSRCSEPRIIIRLQNIFGGLAGLGSVAQVQLEWRRADGRPVATAAVRGRAGETDTLPVFSNKDSIVGDVSCLTLFAGVSALA